MISSLYPGTYGDQNAFAERTAVLYTSVIMFWVWVGQRLCVRGVGSWGGGQGSEFFQTILVSHEQPLLTMMLLCCAEPRSYYLRAPALLQPAGLHWQELLAASRRYTRDLVHCCILQRKQGYTFTCLELCLHSHSLTDVTRGVVSHIIRVTFVKHC